MRQGRGDRDEGAVMLNVHVDAKVELYAYVYLYVVADVHVIDRKRASRDAYGD